MIKEVAAMAKIESHNTLEKILENGIIAISRGNYGDTLLRAVDAAARGKILHPKLRAKHWINLFADSALYWLSARARC